MPTPESRIRAPAERLFRAAGFRLVPIQPTSGNGLDEWPDLILVGTRGRVAWVEFKAPGERPREGQQFVLDLLRDMGHSVWVVDSSESAARVFRSLR